MKESLQTKIAAGIIVLEVIIILLVTIGIMDSLILYIYIYFMLLVLGGIYFWSKRPTCKPDLASAGLIIKASMYLFSVICSIALAMLPNVKDPLFIIIVSIVSVFVIDFIDVIFELKNVKRDKTVTNSNTKSSQMLTDISLKVDTALITVIEDEKKL